MFIDEGRLERILLKNKCRIEQTKRKLENFYTMKVLWPEVFEYYNMESDMLRQVFNALLKILKHSLV